jgi:selenoprotein W-related protein
MATVELEYCVPCDFRRRALDVQAAVLAALEDDIDEFRLVMGADGVFRLSVDGEVVYDKQEEAFDVDGIVRSVRAKLR